MDQAVPSQQTTTIQSHKSILPIVLIVVGSVEIVLPSCFLFVTVPQVLKLYNDQKMSFNPLTTVGPDIFVIMVILLQVIFGIKLYMKQKQMSPLVSRDRKIAIILFVCGGIMSVLGFGFSVAALITPVYELLSTIK